MKKKTTTPPASDPRAMILGMLQVKSGMKQDVYQQTTATFAQLKEVLKEISDDLEKEIQQKDKRITVSYRDIGDTACEMKVAGDVIIFHMHTNVFKLDQAHSLWKTTYMQEDELRGYFGVINIYNFLSDSFKYNRERDLGYLISRLFLNKEGHFFVQGKRQLGFLYNDLPGNTMDRSRLKDVLSSVVIYVLDFDLLTPPYDQVNQVTVSEMNELGSNLQISTGKRLGFRFQAEMDDLT